MVKFTYAIYFWFALLPFAVTSFTMLFMVQTIQQTFFLPKTTLGYKREPFSLVGTLAKNTHLQSYGYCFSKTFYL